MGPGSLPQTCAPSVWVGDGHIAYLGPSLRLGVHSAAVGGFVLGVDDSFVVERAGRSPRSTRSMAVPARVPHRVVAPDGWMLFVFPDPASGRWRACRDRMRVEATVGFDHVAEAELLRVVSRDPASIADVLAVAAPEQPSGVDRRVREVVERIRADPAKHYSVTDAALAAGLSDSHFQRVFAAGVGTSFRRYRLWARMGVVVPALAGGADLTTAAMDAGFSSPSHFSDAFREMFGLSASALLATGARIVAGV